MTNKITETTLIPISLVITLLGGIVVIATMWSEGKAMSSRIDRLEQYQWTVVNDLAVIRTKLGIPREKNE